jgi:hypothetical protein
LISFVLIPVWTVIYPCFFTPFLVHTLYIPTVASETVLLLACAYLV